MDRSELEKLVAEMIAELNGDADHDMDVLYEWGERYREDPAAEPLMREITRRMVSFLAEEDDENVAAQVISGIIEKVDEDYDDACGLIDQRRYEEAIRILQPLVEKIRDFPLSPEIDWNDFCSYLDALVYQDYYSEEIGGREIGRHPLKPGRILYTLGSLLIEMNRAEEALEPLQLLLSYDPVCPKYLIEMGEAYKRTGKFRDAYINAMWTLNCASNDEELSRCYRDLGYCMTEMGAFEDAVMLYLLSLRYQSTRHAQAEIAWIRKKTGISSKDFSEEMILKRCEELEIPVGISETVRNNIEFLKTIQLDDGMLLTDFTDEEE